jgi:hypothetical protein
LAGSGVGGKKLQAEVAPVDDLSAGNADSSHE